MSLSAVLAALDLLDSAHVTGHAVADALRAAGLEAIEVTKLTGPRGTTDAVRVVISGSEGRSAGGTASTLGVIGRLGGIGARPDQIGLVSDADGAVTVLACALKLGRMQTQGDVLPGDVVVATHICPHAPVRPHEPVPFMGSRAVRHRGGQGLRPRPLPLLRPGGVGTNPATLRPNDPPADARPTLTNR